MALTSYTVELSAEQVTALRDLLERQNFEFKEKPYTLYAGSRGKLQVSVYEKGPKVLIQGKETEEFVCNHLEPEVLGEARLGYEEVHHPEWFQPHLGVDESGKGDYFGPLVIAGAYIDGDGARALMEAGIQDSKRITTDKRIRELSAAIRGTRGVIVDVITINPARYNELYAKFANLNKLLAWGHARVIENLLEKVPDCPRALSDKFANERVLRAALMERGRTITVDQQTKAESDPAVAAASIVARERFIDWLRDKGEELGLDLPKGASQPVKAAIEAIGQERPPEFFDEIAKTHFKMGGGA